MSLLLLFHPRSLVTSRKYVLNGTTIKSPSSISEVNESIYALQRMLSGDVSSDLFSGNKRTWHLEYEYLTQTQYDTIYDQYADYMENEQPVRFEINQDNYPLSATEVHVDLVEREFEIPGSSYYSSTTLILTEA